MQKLTLQLEQLRVDTFVTDAVRTGGGTVVARSYGITYQTCAGFLSCNNYTCDNTCWSCAGPSCDAVCPSAVCESNRCVDM